MSEMNIERDLYRLKWRLDYLITLADQILVNEVTIMADLTTLTTQVANSITVEQSAIVLIKGMAAQIAAAGTDPVALEKLRTDLLASANSLADAVTANTPAATPPAA